METFSENNKTRMPVMFIGHGSPMNAIADNSFTQALNKLGKEVPTPKAILCISAHWMTEGTWITEMANPKTIHDFYGFPQELFNVQYPAPGDPAIAKLIRSTVSNPKINGDHELWGLDHGTWSVLKHMYPEANIPVMQLSLDLSQPPEYHFNLGQSLKSLREQGVLIIGSGNIVHNLRRISWEENANPFDWALEFDQIVKDQILKRDYKPLLKDAIETTAGKLSVPTPEHYYPLLYILGASDQNETVDFVYEGIQNATISMRSVAYGLT
jgi:4,5-DOPA dioxygenase extradiol